MSTPVMSPEPTPVKEIPQVTDAYRKAHKTYVLAAGLLASWELIGITLDTKEKWGIELKSPTAVPFILFTLVFYSAYKITVEWWQCDGERRKDRIARLDYIVAHLIGAVAVGISVVQYLTRVQIVDTLRKLEEDKYEPWRRMPLSELHFFVLFLLAGTAAAGARVWKDARTSKRFVFIACSLLGVYFAFALIREGQWVTALVAICFGTVIALAVNPPVSVARYIQKRFPSNKVPAEVAATEDKIATHKQA